MLGTDIPNPNIPNTVDERRAVIESRLRASYPDLAIRVDHVGDFYSIVAECGVGSFTEQAPVWDSANHTVHRLRSYFDDLDMDYGALMRHEAELEAAHEAATERSIAAHEQSLSNED
jgi:hypothetical protein